MKPVLGITTNDEGARFAVVEVSKLHKPVLIAVEHITGLIMPRGRGRPRPGSKVAALIGFGAVDDLHYFAAVFGDDRAATAFSVVLGRPIERARVHPRAALLVSNLALSERLG